MCQRVQNSENDFGDIGKVEIDRQTIAEQQPKADGDRGIAEEVRVDLIAVQEDQQPAVLRPQRLIEREVHIGRHLVEIVRNVKLEEEADQNPFCGFDEWNIRKIFRLDLRHEHFSTRDRPRQRAAGRI